LRGLALLADVHAGKTLVIEPMALNTGRKCDGKKAWVERVTARFRIFQNDLVCADSTRKASKAQKEYPLRNVATSAVEWSHHSLATHFLAFAITSLSSLTSMAHYCRWQRSGAMRTTRASRGGRRLLIQNRFLVHLLPVGRGC
jgi:hypothetical protein